MPENLFKPKLKGHLQTQDVVIFIDSASVAFYGWEDLAVQKDIENLCTKFSFKVPSGFQDPRNEFKLVPMAKVKIAVNNETVITGRIDSISPALETESRYLLVSGRSLTADLIDCSVISPLEYRNIKLDTLAKELIKPFGLKVFLSATPGLIDLVSIKPGDRIFDVLSKYARLQGLFWVTTREGNLRLAFAGNSHADSALEESVNIESASLDLNYANRYSHYIVKGQGTSDDNYPGVISHAPKAESFDKEIKRYKPLVIIAEGAATIETCKKRAHWEATYRAARSVQINCRVQGWQQETGILWGLNQLTRVKMPSLGIDGTFLTNMIQHTRDNHNGTVTNIGLTLKDAYKPEPLIATAKTGLEAVVAFSKKNPKAVD